MGIRSIASKPLAAFEHWKTRQWLANPESVQRKWMLKLVKEASRTDFGLDHEFENIKNYEDFKKSIPVGDYEKLKPYINKILKGDEDVLWPGIPIYLAKTSDPITGVKYIPITKQSIHNYINSAKNAILAYIHETGKSEFLDKKLIFMSGSPETEKKAGILTGSLSGIFNHHVPGYLRTNLLPSYETNCIKDWETKLNKITDETIDQSVSLISGIPSWVQMYFDRITESTGKNIKDIFPDFELLIYGGVNFDLNKARLFEKIGKKIDSIELYPTSEGFIAYQDSQKEEGMLLLLDTGLFFEFIPADEYFNENPSRIDISRVELNKNYALIINSNAGLWGYSNGDTVKFVSLHPHRIVVSGQIQHFISIFDEHVIAEEIEKAMKYALNKHPGTEVVEFTVAPQVSSSEGLPFHEWLIEFTRPPHNLPGFAADLNKKMTDLNVYYKDLIEGGVLRPLIITVVKPKAFNDYIRSVGKLGGQNKVPRLANDRKIADRLR